MNKRESYFADPQSKRSEEQELERERFNEDFMDYAEERWNEALYEYSIAEQESAAIENAMLEELASKLYAVLFGEELEAPRCYSCASPLSLTEEILCDDCAESSALFVTVRHNES